MKRLAAILAALLLCLCVPSAALAQLGPQNVPTPLTEDPDPETINLDEDSGGFSTTQIVLTFGGAIAIIALVAWLIMRDARGKAPAGERGRTSSPAAAAALADGGSPKKSARERERERARKRNKAKAARDQRKRNRPR